jgi:tape measure domain-containing protein
MAIRQELIAVYKGDVKALEKASARARSSIQGVERQAKKSSNTITGFFKKIPAPLKAFGAGLAISSIDLLNPVQIARTADAYKLLQARIEGSTRSSAEFRTAFDNLKNTARETGVALSSTVDIFQRLSFSRDEIGASVEQMALFTDTVSKLGVVSGASTQALNAGLTQLGQGLSAGVLRAEEFNSILENIPAVGQRIADGFGVTVGELRALVLEGEVLSKDVFDVLIAQSKEISAEFERFPTTVDRAMANAKLRIIEAIGALNEGTNSTQGFILAIEVAGRTISALANLISGFANTAKAAFTLVAAQITSAFTGATKAIQGTLNFAIAGLNKLRKEGNKIGKLDFAIDVSDVDIMQAGLADAQEQLKKAGDNFKSAFNNIQVGANESTIATGDLTQGTEELKEKYGALRDQIKGLGEDSEESGKKRKEAEDRAKEALEDYIKVAEEARKKEIERGNEIGDTLFNLGRGYESLRDVAIKALDDILRSMLRLSLGGEKVGGIFGDIGGSIFSGLSGFFGGGGSSFTTAGMQSNIAAALPKFNTGGSFVVGGNSGIDKNTMSLNGRPIANVSKGEKVSISKSGMGGNTINQTINVNSDNPIAVRTEIQKLLPEIKRITIEGVQDASQRGKLQLGAA